MKKEEKIQVIIEEVLDFFNECEEVFELSYERKKEIIDLAVGSLSSLKLSENNLRLASREWLDDQEHKL